MRCCRVYGTAAYALHAHGSACAYGIPTTQRPGRGGSWAQHHVLEEVSEAGDVRRIVKRADLHRRHRGVAMARRLPARGAGRRHGGQRGGRARRWRQAGVMTGARWGPAGRTEAPGMVWCGVLWYGWCGVVWHTYLRVARVVKERSAHAHSAAAAECVGVRLGSTRLADPCRPVAYDAEDGHGAYGTGVQRATGASRVARRKERAALHRDRTAPHRCRRPNTSASAGMAQARHDTAPARPGMAQARHGTGPARPGTAQADVFGSAQRCHRAQPSLANTAGCMRESGRSGSCGWWGWPCRSGYSAAVPSLGPGVAGRGYPSAGARRGCVVVVVCVGDKVGWCTTALGHAGQRDGQVKLVAAVAANHLSGRRVGQLSHAAWSTPLPPWKERRGGEARRWEGSGWFGLA